MTGFNQSWWTSAAGQGERHADPAILRTPSRRAAGLAIVLALLSFLLPRGVAVTRSIVTDAPPEDVFRHVDSLQAFDTWSPPEMGQATAWLDLATVPEGTEVTWGLLADIGLNPVGRVHGPYDRPLGGARPPARPRAARGDRRGRVRHDCLFVPETLWRAQMSGRRLQATDAPAQARRTAPGWI